MKASTTSARPRWTTAQPALAAVAVMSLALALWRHEVDEQRIGIAHDTRLVRTQLARQIEGIVQATFRPVARLARMAPTATGDLELADFDRHAVQIEHDIRAYRLLALVLGAGPAHRVQAGAAGDDTRVGEIFAALWPRALGQQEMVSEFLPAHGNGPETGMVMLIPAAGGRATALGAVLKIDQLLKDQLDRSTLSDFGVRLRDESGRVLFQSSRAGEWPAVADARPAVESGDAANSDDLYSAETVRVRETAWRLQAAPTPAFIDKVTDPTPTWLLAGGAAAAVVAWSIVARVQRYRLAELDRARGNAEELASLGAVATAISGRLGSGADVLDQLVREAVPLLGMTRNLVAVLEDDATMLHCLASVGLTVAVPGLRWPVKLSHVTAVALGENRIVPVENVATSPMLLDKPSLERQGIASLMVVPLNVEGRAIGVMMLADGAPRTFREEDLRLAEVWGSQAAVILANARLYDQLQHALAEQQELLDQREQLSAVTAAIYEQTTSAGALRAIVDLAPGALRVDACGIWLAGKEPGSPKPLAAASGSYAVHEGTLFSGRDGLIDGALETRRPFEVDDITKSAGLNAGWQVAPQVRGVRAIPLPRADGSLVGVLVLVRYQTGGFTNAQRQMGGVLAARAAAAIDNARLTDQARHDAQTNAMLLRELNHRVKNNLSGIVGLLTAPDPNVPPAARQALLRVADRVTMMARAHDLFTGGAGSVSLDKLVEQVINSLAPSRPANVSIDFDPGDLAPQDNATPGANHPLCLDTDRAVSLAMVLHELCYNAIVHGVRDGGRVTILARGADDGRLSIEIADDGVGLPSTEPGTGASPRASTSRSGLGLELVRGLVGRELRGSFSLESRGGHGTVATVRIPFVNSAKQS